mmetsp:Transcript_49258/g.107451  ORF Transcript_49258/g.107451 Transcript_49258/m.107451 type:complete len:349 (-) Transcript_49258:776-1822(-)|eukprot:CAMPEP_0204273032 /NCGR_PEP_ID=MMETSP0468-20130131/22426_1 /ASSEMBLY_ACC=CAM_ASM_000383 /TAXON_ID=2969 /ORGANISM="Oxyrrhis marina" /LENGTH=348 /DNA_ID=CAMNT_0051248959 /DNA_START=32 /DNA_END=1078 /DNA_ORIENTATION=+
MVRVAACAGRKLLGQGLLRMGRAVPSSMMSVMSSSAFAQPVLTLPPSHWPEAVPVPRPRPDASTKLLLQIDDLRTAGFGVSATPQVREACERMALWARWLESPGGVPRVLHALHEDSIVLQVLQAFKQAHQDAAAGGSLEFFALVVEPVLERFLVSQAETLLALQQSHGDSRTPVRDIVDCVASEVLALCYHLHRAAPRIIIDADHCDELFAPFPAGLHYVTREILKNAAKATLDRHGCSFVAADSFSLPDVLSPTPLPEVRVTVRQTAESFDIVVADSAGGMKKSGLASFYTATPSANCVAKSLSGCGVGLPLSAAHCTAMGGSLTFETTGQGTRATLHFRLPRSVR